MYVASTASQVCHVRRTYVPIDPLYLPREGRAWGACGVQYVLC
jgi:hypothetical protein